MANQSATLSKNSKFFRMAMQQLPPVDEPLSAIWSKERHVGDHLPYAAHLDESTILLRDGRLMQVLRLDGLHFETMESEEVDRRKSQLDAAIRALDSSRFALNQHVVRRREAYDHASRFPDPFSARVDQQWRAKRTQRPLFLNTLYLTIILRPPKRQNNRNFISRLLNRQGVEQHKEALDSSISMLQSAVNALESSLFVYGPEKLRTYARGGSIYSEPLEFLSDLLHGETLPVALPDGDLGQYFPRNRISFGARAVEIGDTADASARVAGILAIKGYPSKTFAGFLDSLMRLPFELQVTQTFGISERATAISRIGRVFRRMKSSEDDAATLRDELLGARDGVASGRAVFGEHHLLVTMFAETEAQLDEGLAEAKAVFSELGVIAVREDLALEASFWSQFPGNFQYISRRAMISSTNFADLASLHNFSSGRSHKLHWGEAISILETTSTGPYHFNFHVGDLGNFTVLGPSGSGKTVILNFLLAQARRLDPRIVLFDKDRGSELFIRAIGGRYDSFRRERPSHLNPLQLADTPDNRAFLIDFISVLVRHSGRDLTANERLRIRNAVDANMEAPNHARRLKFFAQLMRGDERPTADDLYARLEPWWGKGDRAWLFDNEADEVELTSRVVGFDMSKILDDPALRTPTMMYLFHRVGQRLDGTPAIIVIDEGWKALDDEVFVRQIRDWEKTIRKQNGILGFATQSAEDALDSSISSTIIEQSATQIFLPNPGASADAYITGFGLTSHELDIVRALPDASHAFLIKQGSDSVVVRLDLSQEQSLLDILSGREATVRILDSLANENGELPDGWLDHFEITVAS